MAFKSGTPGRLGNRHCPASAQFFRGRGSIRRREGAVDTMTSELTAAARYSLMHAASGRIGAEIIGKPETTLHGLCWHEAAHALIRWFFGMPVELVTIKSNGSGFVGKDSSDDVASDNEKIQRVLYVCRSQVESGDLNFDAICADTERILRAHWRHLERLTERLISAIPRDSDDWEVVLSGKVAELIFIFTSRNLVPLQTTLAFKPGNFKFLI
jgi:hypothetical protein